MGLLGKGFKQNKKQKQAEKEKQEKLQTDVNAASAEINAVLGKYDLIFDLIIRRNERGIGIPDLIYLRKSEVEAKQQELARAQNTITQVPVDGPPPGTVIPPKK